MTEIIAVAFPFLWIPHLPVPGGREPLPVVNSGNSGKKSWRQFTQIWSCRRSVLTNWCFLIWWLFCCWKWARHFQMNGIRPFNRNEFHHTNRNVFEPNAIPTWPWRRRKWPVTIPFALWASLHVNQTTKVAVNEITKIVRPIKFSSIYRLNCTAVLVMFYSVVGYLHGQWAGGRSWQILT